MSQDDKTPWYHGTPDRGFTSFNPRHAPTKPRGGGSVIGVWFTNSEEQGDNFRRLALKYDENPRDKSDGRVIEAAIRGRYKPVDVPSLERERSSRKAANPYALGKQREWMLEVAAIANREGYDGVDFINILDDPLSSKNRATHRVVFPHRVAGNIDILHSHTKPPSGELEKSIAAARAERAGMKRPAPPAPSNRARMPKRAPARSWRF